MAEVTNKATLDAECSSLTELINENRRLIEELAEIVIMPAPALQAKDGPIQREQPNIDCLETFFDETTGSLHTNNNILRTIVERFSQYINAIKILS